MMPARRAILSLTLFAWLAWISPPLMAGGFEALRLNADQHPKLDGILDEDIWKKAVPFDNFYQTQPTDKVAAHVRTEVRIAYDAKYLYFGIMAFDPDPAQIRAPFTRRDRSSDDQDLLGLYIDTSGASKKAQYIHLNARGAISDGIFTDATLEDSAADFDFDVATVRVDGGWSAEIRIPFSSLPYDAAQKAPWKLLVYRNMTRDERYRMYSGQVTRESTCLMCFSEPITALHDLPTGLNWTATPQLVLGRGRESVEGEPRRDFKSRELSLDVKVRPDSATTVDLTINPDFSQVELDEPQLSGNTTFSLFFPEKRPFFIEGSDILQTPFRAIHTRTITDPAWGARYTRRDGNMDVTLLTTRDNGGGMVQLPSAYRTGFVPQQFASLATVARANFHNGGFSVGALLTDRTLQHGNGYNRVVGPDFAWQRSDTESLRGQVLLSATSAQPGEDGSLQKAPQRGGHAAKLEWIKENEHWGVTLAAEEISDGFRADNGFIPQAGYKELGGVLSKKWGALGALNAAKNYLFLDRKIDRDGMVIGDEFYLGTWLAGPYDSQLDLRLKPANHLRVERDGQLFTLRQVAAVASVTPGHGVAQVYGELEFGDEVDVEASRLGKGGKLQMLLRLEPTDRIAFQPSYSVSWVDGREGAESGQRLYTEYAAQLNGIFHFGPRDSLRMILQKTSLRRNPALYPFPVVALSKSRTGSLVYNHIVELGSTLSAGLTVQNGDSPGYAPYRLQNEVFVKLSWQLRR